MVVIKNCNFGFCFILMFRAVMFVGSQVISSEEIWRLEGVAEYGCRHCYCGVGLDTRVVGGQMALFSMHPWLVALHDMRSGGVFCSATLISDSFVLTAAHCFNSGISPDRILAMLLDSNRRIIKILKHPEFNRKTLYNNDIALLRFNLPIDFSTSYSLPACLPRPDLDHVNKVAIVAGWGKMSENDTHFGLLNQVTVPILHNELCKMLKGYEHITENMICAGYFSGGKDACQGDSGGPLITEDSNRYTVTGIVSFGIGCGRKQKPGVYTRVNKYIMWIIRNTMDSCFCY